MILSDYSTIGHAANKQSVLQLNQLLFKVGIISFHFNTQHSILHLLVFITFFQVIVPKSEIAGSDPVDHLCRIESAVDEEAHFPVAELCGGGHSGCGQTGHCLLAHQGYRQEEHQTFQGRQSII